MVCAFWSPPPYAGLEVDRHLGIGTLLHVLELTPVDFREEVACLELANVGVALHLCGRGLDALGPGGGGAPASRGHS